MKKLLLILTLLTCIAAGAQNVGIGEPLPIDMRLQVKDSDSAIMMLQNSSTAGINIKTAMYFKTGNSYSGSIGTIGSGATFRMGLFTYGGSSPSALLERISILDGGNVGIGNIAPQAKLDVNGTVKITDGTQGIDKVLTSDANGLARWAAAAGGLTLPYSASLSTTQALIALANDNGSCFTAYSPVSGTYGFRGVTSGGIGVGGSANSGTGIEALSNTGIAAVFQSQTGLAIKTLGGNVEINGKIKVVDGTQGTGKLLTSSSDGTASWVVPTISTGFTAIKTGSSQNIPPVGGASVKVDFNTGNASFFGTGYNIATSQFTAPVAGFYQFNVVVNFVNSISSGSANQIFINLVKNNTTFYTYELNHTATIGSHAFGAMIPLSINETVDVRVTNNSGFAISVLGGSVNFPYTFFSGYRIN